MLTARVLDLPSGFFTDANGCMYLFVLFISVSVFAYSFSHNHSVYFEASYSIEGSFATVNTKVN